MNKLIFWFNIFLLVTIHTADMLLTERCIGNEWQHETFLPMSLCIKNFGIYNAMWISRAGMYLLILLFFIYKENKYWMDILIILNILYWTSMIDWLFNLHIITWPFS